MRLRAAFRTLAAGTVLALVACARSQPEHAHSVVLIVLDTVRADHVSCYGYARRTTPNLDALAAAADRYTLARSTAPWTLPSHASLFTGRFTYQHGAESRKQPDGKISDGWPLGEDQTTLAEVLKGEGFRTAAFVANKGYVTRRNGLAQGFETFFNARIDAASLSAEAIAWLAEPTAKPPFFLFLNYMDAHRPYNVRPLAGARAGELPPPPGESPVQLLDQLYEAVFAHAEPPDPALVQRVVDAYDLGIANDDAALGLLLDALEARGLFDDALIIVTADHGEYIGEHDLVEHSKDVYETALRVPLIVKLPGQTRGRVIEAPISIADIARLVIAAQPREIVARHSGKFPGTNARSEMFAEIGYSRPRDLAAPWGRRFARERSALYEGRYKLIRSSDGQHELYDLRSDPGEEHNLFSERAREAALLMQRLENLQAVDTRAASPQPAPPLASDELEALRELGYVDDDATSHPMSKH